MNEYAPLWCKSNFSFLEGASHAEELVEEAHRLGLRSLAIDRAVGANLTRLVTIGRRRGDKGDSLLAWSEICAHAQGLIALWGDLLGDEAVPSPELVGDLRAAFGDRLYAILSRHSRADDVPREARVRARAAAFGIPLVAANEVLYHSRARRPLQDVLPS